MDTNAIYKVGYGLYVLSANDGGKDNGCIINTVMQITSNEPFKFIISVNKANLTHDMIKNSGKFNVSILTEETPFSVFETFGFKSGRDADKFSEIDCAKRAENSLLYLDKYANAYLSFDVIDAVDCDTHTIFVAKLSDAVSLSNGESLTYAYYHKHIKPQPKKSEKKVTGWRCVICGYIYDGEELPPDFICPWCKHGAADFEKIEA